MATTQTVELDIPKSAKKRELRRLASEFAKDSIVTDALSRLIEQVIETTTEHVRAELEAENERLRADTLRIVDSYASPNHDNWFFEMRKKLAALKQEP